MHIDIIANYFSGNIKIQSFLIRQGPFKLDHVFFVALPGEGQQVQLLM